ncbi:hypothetical protein CSTERTH_03190 [Thermoclostridium stercorarium subsp. thermolacticum DSM 2910]|uniref:Pyrrolo-quinoline quinone repeat domain-containing protein n=2 Tax=Thermoclostridium stercorarium TaxID=1510 RepID=A0A1B1YBK2_THEST|nr:PQQ-binding-like beta-propeller repeat protein [Thermoclostridium stercorarium]ANW98118.1 hypothetical protein CSTERTH_03190 [Thermoclostridium stercorarium subsp. thermolacticum DSM 2910]
MRLSSVFIIIAFIMLAALSGCSNLSHDTHEPVTEENIHNAAEDDENYKDNADNNKENNNEETKSSIRSWKDMYQSKWTFCGDLDNNYPIDDTGQVLIAYGNDNQISGYHSDTYLYGLNKDTGEKIWSVYGGYYPIHYCINEPENTILIGTKPSVDDDTRLQCIEITTGKLLWEKIFSFEIRRLAITDKTVAVQPYNLNTIMVLDVTNGEVLWEKELEQNEVLISLQRQMNNIIVSQKDGLAAYEPSSGQMKWKVEGNLFPESPHPMIMLPDVIESKQYQILSKNTNTQWITFEDCFRKIDFNTGEVLDSISTGGINLLYLLDGEFSIVKSYEKEDNGNLFTKSFSLYSNSQKNELFSKNDTLLGAVVYQNKLIYTTPEKIKCISLDTSDLLWECGYSFGPPEAYSPLIIQNRLVIVSNDKIHVFNPDSGEYLYQVDDYNLPVYPILDILVVDHSPSVIYVSGNEIYISRNDGHLDALILK